MNNGKKKNAGIVKLKKKKKSTEIILKISGLIQWILPNSGQYNELYIKKKSEIKIRLKFYHFHH